MPFIAAGAFILGLVIAYLLFARSANKRANLYQDDLKAAKSLLDEAQKEREQLKQELADCQYKMKELEKDLKHAQK
jgi:septal ring factor EnvC (AmiA/AmiB activator)